MCCFSIVRLLCNCDFADAAICLSQRLSLYCASDCVATIVSTIEVSAAVYDAVRCDDCRRLFSVEVEANWCD
jgi:hypothetical protein